MDHLNTPVRARLPKQRRGFTQEAVIGDKDRQVTITLTTGEYEDGRLGEVFIDVATTQELALRSMVNLFAISISLGLQYGVPLEALVEQFTFTRFEPNGIVQHDDTIKLCTSVVDYVFRVLGVHYLGRSDFAHVVQAAREAPSTVL